MLLVLKQRQEGACPGIQVVQAAVDHTATEGDRALFIEGHFSVEGHLGKGGNPAEGAARALEILSECGLDRLCAAASGEFALVLVDRMQVTLVADILDSVPLYWGEASLPAGGRLVCIGTDLAQVAEGLMAAAGHRCVPDKLFLSASLVSAAHLLVHTHRTPLIGIRRVPGGHRVHLEMATGARHTVRYWDPARITPLQIDVPSAIERLDETLEAAVRECFAYGQVGISVSGGLDSGSVAAYAARLAPDRTHCLTLGSDRWHSIPEEKYARRNVETLGLKLRVVSVDDLIPFQRFCPHTVYTGGLPVNILAEYHHRLADTAQGLGAATMLDGDGGDELFGVGNSPRYLRELVRSGQVGRALSHLRGWNRFQAVSPFQVFVESLSRPDMPLPQPPSWLLRGAEAATLYRDPAAHAPASIAQRVRAHYARMNLTENWWGRRAVYQPRRMRLLHPLRARALADLTYAVPQWILQNPGEYKWFLRQTMRLKFPQIPFEPVNHDYSHLITHGVRLARERLTSLFSENSRLIAHGIATPEILSFARRYLRDPAGAEDWAADGIEVVGQTALFTEMWLRGYEEIYGK